MDSVYLELTVDDEDSLFYVSEALFNLAMNSAGDRELASQLHLIGIKIAQVMLGAHERRNKREGTVDDDFGNDFDF